MGLCSAWLVSVPLAYAFTVPAVLRSTGIRARELMAECSAPAVAAGAMYAVVMALRVALDGQPATLVLFAFSAAGAIVYTALMALGSRRHLVIARNFARSLISRDAASTAN
jgi:hypothetical protein